MLPHRAGCQCGPDHRRRLLTTVLRTLESWTAPTPSIAWPHDDSPTSCSKAVPRCGRLNLNRPWDFLLLLLYGCAHARGLPQPHQTAGPRRISFLPANYTVTGHADNVTFTGPLSVASAAHTKHGSRTLHTCQKQQICRVYSLMVSSV